MKEEKRKRDIVRGERGREREGKNECNRKRGRESRGNEKRSSGKEKEKY